MMHYQVFLKKIRKRLENTIINNFAVKGIQRHIDGINTSIPVPFDYDIVPSSLHKIAVICPIFHEELSEELKHIMKNIPFNTDVFISTDTEFKMTHILNSFDDWSSGKVNVRLCKNRGRDIAPKLTVFLDVYENYDLVLYLHSKKSLSFSIGDRWRNFLTDNLIGSPDVVKSIVEIFSTNPNIGLVMSKHFEPIGHLIRWDGNYSIAKRLAKRMGINITKKSVIDMPSGSMFWFRPMALKPLLDLKLNHDDFPPEKGQLRGTLHHAIERLILYVVESSGFTWVKVGVSNKNVENFSNKNISSKEELIKLVDSYNFKLLK